MMRFNGKTISAYACTSQDAASLSATNHLTMKHKLVMLINQRAALPHRERQAMHSDARSKGFVFAMALFRLTLSVKAENSI